MLTENVHFSVTENIIVYLLGVVIWGFLFLLFAAQRRLEELQSAIGNAEQQVLKMTGELQQLEDALAQKKVCEEVAT